MPKFDEGRAYRFDLITAIQHSGAASPGYIARCMCHLDGLPVRVIDKDTGSCNGCLVIPDWCKWTTNENERVKENG